MRTSGDTQLVSAPKAGLPVRAFDDATAPVSRILAPLVPRLAKHDYWFENERLVVPIARNHLGSAGVIIDAVRKNPDLKPHILFDDGTDRRTFDDVVWDLEKNPRLFTHIIDQERGRVQPIRVLITPVIKGPGDANIINCADIKFAAPPLENLMLAVRLHTQFNGEAAPYKNGVALCGRRMIVQTDRIAVTGIDELRMNDKMPTITMHIVGEQPCMRLHDTSTAVPSFLDRSV